MFSLAWIGDSDLGLHHVLSGCCKTLRRLQATGCPFGDRALVANAGKLETVQYLWMSQCKVTVVVCRLLEFRMPRLAVEMVKEPVETEPVELLL